METGYSSMSKHWFKNSEFFYEGSLEVYKDFLIKKQDFEKFRINGDNIYRFNPNLIVGERFITCKYKDEIEIDGLKISRFKVISWSNVDD